MKKLDLINIVREELRGWSPQIGHTKGLTSKTLNNILMKIASGEDWEPDNEVGKKIKEAFSQIEEERPGLWANIRAKRARGEKPAHKNSKAHKDAVAAGKKINKASSNEEVDVDNKITVLSVIDGKRNLDNDQIRQLFDDSTAGTFYIYAVEEGEEEFHKPVSKQDAYKYIDYYNARLKKDYKREEKLGAELGVLGIESELHFHKGEFKTDPSVFSKNENYADGKVNESGYEEAYELLGQSVPEIQKFVKEFGFENNDTTAKKIGAIIDNIKDTSLAANKIPGLKNLANKGDDAKILKAITQISGKPDAEQQYVKLMQARDAGEDRNRGYDVSNLFKNVKSGNYEPPVLLQLPSGLYVIGGRTRLYAALALGIQAKVKIINHNTFGELNKQEVKKSQFETLIREVIRETIRKVDGKYVVYPEKGGKRLGTHSTKKAAEKQLTAIHLNKEEELPKGKTPIDWEKRDWKLFEAFKKGKVIVYHNFQGVDADENIAGTNKVLNVADCIGNEPGKDYNYFTTEKKQYVEDMIKNASGDGWKKFPPIIAIPHPILSGKYSVIDGNHRLGAFTIGKLPQINARILSDDKIELAEKGVEWDKNKLPKTISLADAKKQGVNLKKYFATQPLKVPSKEKEITVNENSQLKEGTVQDAIRGYLNSEIGKKYARYDCKSVTRAFVKWATDNGIETKVITLAPPSAEFIKQNPKFKGKSGEGDGHIMPIVNDQAIDFTVRQFGVNRSYQNPLITPLKNVKSVYSKFGYYTDTPEWFNGGKSDWIGPLNNIPSDIFNQEFGDEILENYADGKVKEIVDDILSGLNEGALSGVLDKMKQYAKKGLLTLAVVASVTQGLQAQGLPQNDIAAINQQGIELVQQTANSVDRISERLIVQYLGQEKFDNLLKLAKENGLTLTAGVSRNLTIAQRTAQTRSKSGINGTVTSRTVDSKTMKTSDGQYLVIQFIKITIQENYADGKVKGKSRPGRVKKAGASCKGSVTDLRAKAKKYGGEKGKMYHWCANMKGGKK